MKMKTYLTTSLALGVEQIKKELGPKALLLSTKHLSSKENPDWLGGNYQLEMTAMLPETKEEWTEWELKQKPNFEVSLKNSVIESDLKEPSFNFKEVSIEDFTGLKNETKKKENLQVLGEFIENLKNQGVHPLLLELIETSLHHSSINLSDQEALLDQTILLMSQNMIKTCDLFEGFTSKSIALVGPSGVGKTATLIKMAQHAIKDNQHSVAIISYDPEFLGRSYLLKQFCDAHRIPFSLLSHPEQFQTQMHNFKEKDLILIDTEGLSPYDTQKRDNLILSLSACSNLEVSLTLPAHLSLSDLENHLFQFAALGYQNLIFTKLDETSCFGNLLNASYLTDLPLSFFATGQQNSNSLEMASIARVLDGLFGLNEKLHKEEFMKLNHFKEEQMLAVNEKIMLQ